MKFHDLSMTLASLGKISNSMTFPGLEFLLFQNSMTFPGFHNLYEPCCSYNYRCTGPRSNSRRRPLVTNASRLGRLLSFTPVSSRWPSQEQAERGERSERACFSPWVIIPLLFFFSRSTSPRVETEWGGNQSLNLPLPLFLFVKFKSTCRNRMRGKSVRKSPLTPFRQVQV